MSKRCLICNADSADIILNNIAMEKCERCGFIWQKNFNLKASHYNNLEVDLSKEKLDAREKNCQDRVNLFKKYIDLNNLCDIGTGEGIFLKVLKAKGYKNICGIEPSKIGQDYAEKNNLRVICGFINDFPEIKRKYHIKVITLFHVIEHLVNPKESLGLIYQNMEIGDHLIIETPNINAFSFKNLNYHHHLIYPEHFFYFNEENLRKLLIDINYKIIANGRRDFNQNYLNMSDILLRWGLLKNSKYIKFFNKFNKKFLVYLPSKLIQILGRLDYQWVIVKK